MARKQAATKTDATPAQKPVRSFDMRRRILVALAGMIVVVITLMVAGVQPSSVLESVHRGGTQTILNPDAALASFYEPSVRRWNADIHRWAQEYGVNPNVIAIVIQIESCGDPVAMSGAGALGLMQVMPFHFRNGENMLNPNTNVERGMGVFYECLMQFANGDLGLALACYNGGPSVTQRPSDTWAAETQYYYRWATGLWDDVVHGRDRSTTLDSWLDAGGERLCRAVKTS